MPHVWTLTARSFHSKNVGLIHPSSTRSQEHIVANVQYTSSAWWPFMVRPFHSENISLIKRRRSNFTYGNPMCRIPPVLDGQMKLVRSFMIRPISSQNKRFIRRSYVRSLPRSSRARVPQCPVDPQCYTFKLNLDTTSHSESVQYDYHKLGIVTHCTCGIRALWVLLRLDGWVSDKV